MNNKTLNFKNGLHFVSIGGSSEIGMNLYAYIYNDQWILIDMGMGFDNTLGRELIVPFPQLLLQHKDKIKALFITHSHEDHIGAIPYLWPMIKCPIYARGFALGMIREKLREFDLSSEVPLIKAALNKEINIADFKVEFISVAHSTPESSALAITTPAGVIIHTGDWRLDDNPVLGDKTDEDSLKKYGDKGVLALMCDSTNVFKSETYGSERGVRETITQLIKEHPKKRIIITCFASNVARLETCYFAAKAAGRNMIISGKSIKKIEKVAREAGYLSKISPFIDETQIEKMNPVKSLIVCTGSQGETNSSLSKIANGIHKNIKISEDDIIIFSSRVIPGNEKSVLEIQNLLIKKGVAIINDGDCDVHASGHPSKKELEHLYSLIKPNILLPIHGEIMQLHKHASVATNYGIKNVLIPVDGNIIKIEKDNPNVVGAFEQKKLCVDGFKLIPIDGDIYKQRAQLSFSGVVSISFTITKAQKLSLQEFYTFGVFNDTEKDEYMDVKNDIASETTLCDINKNLNVTRDLVSKIIKRILYSIRGKKPLVIVHICD